MVQHDLRVDVLDKDPEALAVAVDLVVPLKVGGEGEVDAERGPGDWFNSIKLSRVPFSVPISGLFSGPFSVFF